MIQEPRSSELSAAVAAALPAAAERDPMEVFMVRERANLPQRERLTHPTTMQPTEHWLDIVSSLSDSFRAARDSAMQKAVSISAIANDEKRREATKESQLEMAASLVAGWSFSKPCTKDNVMKFLREAPQVYNMVLRVSDENERFFKDA